MFTYSLLYSDLCTEWWWLWIKNLLSRKKRLWWRDRSVTKCKVLRGKILSEGGEEISVYLWPSKRKKSIWDSVALSCICNSKNQLSELCLLPWRPDRNTQGERTTSLPLAPASSKSPSSPSISPHPSPNPLYFLHLQLLADLSPAVMAHCCEEVTALFMYINSNSTTTPLPSSFSAEQ